MLSVEGHLNPGLFNPRPFNPGLCNHELSNPGLFNPRLFNHELFNPVVQKFILESPGLRCPSTVWRYIVRKTLELRISKENKLRT